MRTLQPQFAYNELVRIVGTGDRYEGKVARVMDEDAYGCWVRVEDETLKMPLRHIHKCYLMKLSR